VAADGRNLLVRILRLSAAAALHRYAASFTGCGSSWKLICERLRSSLFDTLLVRLLLVAEILLSNGMEMQVVVGILESCTR
jgi:hypothetical protein